MEVSWQLKGHGHLSGALLCSRPPVVVHGCRRHDRAEQGGAFAANAAAGLKWADDVRADGQGGRLAHVSQPYWSPRDAGRMGASAEDANDGGFDSDGRVDDRGVRG